MSGKLNTLILGGGGREYAYGWKIAQSPRCGNLYFMPGNGGTALLGTNIPFSPPEWEALPSLVQQIGINLVLVGPEAPLAGGVVDILRTAGVAVVGPTKAAAQLETSKAWAKELMLENKIPTAPFCIFSNYDEAIDYVRTANRPLYIKASGLCGGKGAFPAPYVGEAERVLERLMVKRELGSAANEVVIEDTLSGYEISAHAFCDGTSYVMAPPTQDHKRLLPDGEYLPDGTNPNTGGMGAYGPVPGVSRHDLNGIKDIVAHTLVGVAGRARCLYRGILYPGLMMTQDGPRVLEYNIRGGDPETQVLMRLLKSDALDLFEALAQGGLKDTRVEWHQDLHAVCVNLVSDGYPGKYRTGYPITGIEDAEVDPYIKVFHAGTEHHPGHGFFTNGGRVLSVTAVGSTLGDAVERAYKAVGEIHFDGMRYRKDIAAHALKQVVA